MKWMVAVSLLMVIITTAAYAEKKACAWVLWTADSKDAKQWTQWTPEAGFADIESCIADIAREIESLKNFNMNI